MTTVYFPIHAQYDCVITQLPPPKPALFFNALFLYIHRMEASEQHKV
jgi:hypothetical protein